ncbi:hypothetical protein DFH08DRAFT_998874 [Mycena albidolilacea]|uniref:PPM-type phosphatase domain-containing protein n=1 Tax=Mycena albidolilacea TaxID=1033008 RepID=A0AAD7A4B1_9AGAR|nr:hypothetical protein DFH08DRAFT_998874 [Mycena albidolilacea]
MTHNANSVNSAPIIFGTHVASRPGYCAGAGIGASEDRYCVEEWVMLDGTWTFAAVFDGRNGSAAADFVLKTLPPLLETSLSASLAAATHLDDKVVGDLLSDAITSVDSLICAQFLSLVEGVALDTALDEDIAVRLSASEGHAIHVANLGYCDASNYVPSLSEESPLTIQTVLYTSDQTGSSWQSQILFSLHNCRNPAEVARLQREHSGETGAVSDKLSGLPELVDHNHMPPYLSNVPEILHAHSSPSNAAEKFLFIASDGLCDLVERIHLDKGTPEKSLLAQPWGAVASAARKNGKNMAVEIWDAFGGDGGDNRFQEVLDDKFVGRVDDTTIIVVPL